MLVRKVELFPNPFLPGQYTNLSSPTPFSDSPYALSFATSNVFSKILCSHFASYNFFPFLELFPVRHAREVKSCIFLIGLLLLTGAISEGQTPLAAPAPAPVDEENYVPPWMKEESKESEGFRLVCGPCLRNFDDS